MKFLKCAQVVSPQRFGELPALNVKDLEDSYNDIFVQNPRSAIFHEFCSSRIQDPKIQKFIFCLGSRSLGSHDIVAVAGSNIPKIPRENKNTGSVILQFPRSWILRVRDPGSFWDLGTCLFLTVTALTNLRAMNDLRHLYPWSQENMVLDPLLTPSLKQPRSAQRSLVRPRSVICSQHNLKVLVLRACVCSSATVPCPGSGCCSLN